MDNKILKLLAASVVSLSSFNVYAIPVLQIGPDALDPSDPTSSTDPDATYVGGGDDTWYLSNDGSSFSFNAYNTGDEGFTAYLVFAATPMLTDNSIDYFDLTVSDGTKTLSLVESGVGAPPTLDPNSLAPHDIFDTYFEVFELTFDGPLTTIGNTEPNGLGGGSADGYYENISVLFNILNEDVTGIHIDMFTIDGAWSDSTTDKNLVTAFAPFSHDAQVVVPIPAAAWLFASGLIGLAGVARRKTA